MFVSLIGGALGMSRMQPELLDGQGAQRLVEPVPSHF